MLRRKINFSIGALIITVVGAGASLIIINTAAQADQFGYEETLSYQP